jgi:hypothetical protein
LFLINLPSTDGQYFTDFGYVACWVNHLHATSARNVGLATLSLMHTVSTPAFARKTTTPVKMVPVETATEIMTAVAQNTQMIATNADEFGGYFYPVAGIGLLATLILYLSPPLSDN